MTVDLHECFQYVDCDIPAGMTIAAWKHERAEATRGPSRHHWPHLRRRGH